MRVIGQGVEKEIGQPVPGEMLGRRLPLRENKASWIDAALDGFAAKVVLDEFVRVQEPKHAPRDSHEKTHPDVEKLWRDLIGIVERAKDEALFRKSAFGARRRDVRDQPLGVVWLIAMRQMDDFLAVEGLPAPPQHEGIGDHIVDETGTHGSWKADEAHLHGSWSLRGNPGARTFRIALQFNENIDSI